MAKTTPRIQELANKIGGGTDVAPHQIDEPTVKSASASGNIDSGEADEFMQFLNELAVARGGSDAVDGNEDLDEEG